MSPVLQPVNDPPLLDRYCYLSNDARIVMEALNIYYQRQKEELQKSTMQLPGASDYYRSMYSAKFGVSVKRSNDSSQNVTKSGNISLKKTQTGGVPLVQLTPDVRTRKMNYLLSTDQLSTPGQNSDLTNSCSLASRQTTPMATHSLKSLNKQSSLHDIEHITRCKAGHCVSRPALRTSNLNLAFETSSPVQINAGQKDGRGFCVQLSGPSDSPPMETQEVTEMYTKNRITNFTTSPSLFSQDDVMLTELNCDISEKEVSRSENKIEVEEISKNKENIDKQVCSFPAPYFSKDKDKVRAWISDDRMLKHVNDSHEEHPNLDGNEEISKCSEECTANQTALCTINERLNEHKKVRIIIVNPAWQKLELELFSKENSGQLKQMTLDSLGKVKKKSSSSKFEIPLKRKKLENVHDGNLNEDLFATRSSSDSLIDVSTMCEVERQKLSDIISLSKEVLVSLIYKDGSTQLRDHIPCNMKKKSSTTKIHSSDEVSSVTVMPITADQMSKADHASSGNFTTIYSFPVELKNSQFKVWNKMFKSSGFYSEFVQRENHPRLFWEKLLCSSTRTICCKAKDLMNTVVKIFGAEQLKVSTECIVLDPIIAAWLLDPDKNITEFREALTTCKLQIKEMSCLVPTLLLIEDFQLMSRLMEILEQDLRNKELWELYYCVETRLTPLLSVMELRKIKIDTDVLVKFSDVLKKKMMKLEQKAHSSVGHSFSLTSHAQLRQVLFEELNLASKLPQKTKLPKTNVGHQTSTSETVLTQLVDFHPLPSVLLEYRQMQKLKSTYIDGMMSCVRNNYLSTHWDQTSAVTGRLSSYHPNIQAIPKSSVTITEYEDNYIIGKENDSRLEIFARDPFISHDGWSFLAADFQQIELRILAHLADDPVLLKIFRENKTGDIFLELASQWLGKPITCITSADREQTKRVVYSVMYGAGKEKLAEYLKIGTENAKAIMNSFLDIHDKTKVDFINNLVYARVCAVKFPAVNTLTRKCIEFCQENGYTKTIFKRRRLFPNINHSFAPMRAQAERQAFNFCVQGSAADLCKAAMLQVEHALKEHLNLQAKLLVQIHDELLLEVADADLEIVQDIVRSVMEDERTLCGNMVQLKVPIKVSLSIGKTWGHMKPVLQNES